MAEQKSDVLIIIPKTNDQIVALALRSHSLHSAGELLQHSTRNSFRLLGEPHRKYILISLAFLMTLSAPIAAQEAKGDSPAGERPMMRPKEGLGS